MIAEITQALAALTTAKDFTKAVMGSKIDAALREQAIQFQFSIIEAQSAMMEMQSKYQALLQEKDGLKQQLVDLEQWNTESAKYELTEISPHVFAYALKPDESSTAPKHWLCAKCYEDKQKSIIQKGIPTPMGDMYSCGRCEAQIFVQPVRPTRRI